MSDPINLDDHRRRRADIEAVPDAETVDGDVEQYTEEPTRTVYVDVTSTERVRVPVIPHTLRGWDNFQATVTATVREWLHVTGAYAFRSPMYAVKATGWAPVGLARILGRQFRWWWAADLARTKGGTIVERLALHKEVRRTRLTRAPWLIIEALAVAIGVPLAWWLAPWWVLALILAVAVPPLARVGRPVDRPIITEITMGPRFTRLTAEMVRQALVDLGLPKITDPASITFPPPGVHRDPPGWLARTNLPRGVEAIKVIEKRAGLSSALRLPVDQVWPTVGPDHAGQLDLWVGYQPASKMGQPPWSLASPTARTSVFEPFPFGYDERMRPKSTTLFQRNYLAGGQPGSGKTFGARALAIGALLDPTVEMWLAAFKPSEDFHDMAEFCARYECGIDDTTMSDAERMVADGLQQVQRRQELLGRLKRKGAIKEGRTDPDLAARQIGLHPLVLVFDEVHELFLASKQAAADLIRLVKQGRSAGVIAILATQVAGKDSVPPELTRCVSSRWCMSVADFHANDQIMGTGAYKRGLSGTAYRPEVDAGWGVTAGMSVERDGPARSYYPNQKELAVIFDRIRALRGGRVVGDQVDAQQSRDILDDVGTLFVPSERGLHWETIAERLAGLDPAYQGITAEVVSARLRALGVPLRQVKVDGVNRNGVRREEITAAIDRRTLER